MDATLASLRSETPEREAEVVLVDNGMTAERRAELDRIFTGKLAWLPGRLVREEAPGLGHARLKGFAVSRGEILVWLDDDNTVAPGFFATLMECVSHHPQWGAICPAVWPCWDVPAEPWLEDAGIDFLSYNLLPAELPRREWTSADARKAMRAPGGGMILHREVMTCYAENRLGDARVGLARTGDGFEGCEDADMFAHVWTCGRRAVVDARLRVWHHIPARRCETGYLFRINRGMLRSYVRLARADGAGGPRLWVREGLIGAAGDLRRGLRLAWRHRRLGPLVPASGRIVGRWSGLIDG